MLPDDLLTATNFPARCGPSRCRRRSRSRSRSTSATPPTRCCTCSTAPGCSRTASTRPTHRPVETRHGEGLAVARSTARSHLVTRRLWFDPHEAHNGSPRLRWLTLRADASARADVERLAVCELVVPVAGAEVGDRVLAPPAVDSVVLTVVAQGDQVLAAAEVDAIATAVVLDLVSAGTGVDHVGVDAKLEELGFVSAVGDVVTAAPEQPVALGGAAEAAVEDVVALVAFDPLATGLAS